MSEQKIIGIVQARMNSSRLPGKVMKIISGKPLVWHIVNRLRSISLISDVIIATTDDHTDIPLCNFAKNQGISCYAGKIDDIIDRVISAGSKFNADIVVKINSDCPLIDPILVEKGIKTYLSSTTEPDLVTNSAKDTFPEGMQYGIFNFKTLLKITNNLSDPFWREYIFRYLIENPQKFKVLNIENKQNLSSLRWTVDYPEDLNFVQKIYENLFNQNPVFSMEDILLLLNKLPELSKINQMHSSNIGLKSFEELKNKHNQLN